MAWLAEVVLNKREKSMLVLLRAAAPMRQNQIEFKAGIVQQRV